MMADRPSATEYHEALNGLWVAFSREFEENDDLFVVRRAVDVLIRGHKTGLPISGAIRLVGDPPAEVRRDRRGT